MKESLYLKLKAQIERDYKKKLDALETIWELSGNRNGKPSTISPSRGHVASVVRKIVMETDEPFNIIDIEAEVKKTQPDAKRLSIATVLRRMKIDGIIEIVKPGFGRTPHVFKKKV